MTVPNPLPRSAIGKTVAVFVAVLVVVAVAFVAGAGDAGEPLAGHHRRHRRRVDRLLRHHADAARRSTDLETTRVRAFIPLFIANAVFWSLFQQIFTVLAVYSDERMNWSIFGWIAPSSWIGSIEPVWIILLSPLFALMWTRLGNRAPTTPRKFAYGVIGMGLAFLLFLPMAGTSAKAVPALLVVAILAVFAVSELLLSPIGLSVTTKLAPDAFRAQMMALYFFSVGLGTSMSGVLAKLLRRLTRVRLLRHPRRGRDRCRRGRVLRSRRGSADRWRACTDRSGYLAWWGTPVRTISVARRGISASIGKIAARRGIRTCLRPLRTASTTLSDTVSRGTLINMRVR